MALSEAALGAIISGAATVTGAGISGFASGRMNKRAEKFNREEAANQRAWSEKMTAQQNAFNMELWNKENEYNSPEAQLERLRAAGLNPLYYGLDGTGNAGSLTAAQPLNYERAQAPNYDNPAAGLAAAFQSAGNMYLQGQSVSKDIELKNAQIDEIKERTKGLGLDNEWKDKTLEARAESETIRNTMTKEQIENVKQQRKNMEQDLKKAIAETENELEKKLLIQAQTNLTKMQEKEIAEMLPLKKLLTQAQTQAQKASAAAQFTHAAYEKGLIDAGYIDDLCREMESRANDAESRAHIDAFKDAVKHGNVWSEDTGRWLNDNVAHIMNGLFNSVSLLGEAITGPIAGILK